MSWAKTTLCSNLEDIRAVLLEKHRGYGRLLLDFVEKNARNHLGFDKYQQFQRL
jgi:hypothetical protein